MTIEEHKPKIRVWNKERKYYPPITEDSDYSFSVNESGELYVVDNGNPAESKYEIELYTGKTDAAGDEICQGDIVRTVWIDPMSGQEVQTDAVVRYDTAGMGFYLEGLNRYARFTSDCVIIGTINENPELLEGIDDIN